MTPGNTSSSPRDIANTAEKAVVSLPQRALSLLLFMSLGQQDGEASSTDLGSDRAEISAAIDYVERTFLSAFETAAGGVEDDLVAATENLKSILTAVYTGFPNEEDDASARVLLDLKQRVEDELTPAVAAFLSALFDSVVRYERASAKLAKDVDATASQIDEIARQINFIAINASVEAARVGDAGRGFAVIASEIKQLSDRSRDAVERVRSSAF